MERLKEKKCTKKIICIIIILMLCNFIIPNYSFAVTDPEDDNKLLEPLAQALCLIPDIVIGFLQNMFVSPRGLEVEQNVYQILYSPATIFAGEIPAFDINFINPGKSKVVDKIADATFLNGATLLYEKKYASAGLGSLDLSLALVTKDGIIKDIKNKSEYEYSESRETDINWLEGKINAVTTYNAIFRFR